MQASEPDEHRREMPAWRAYEPSTVLTISTTRTRPVPSMGGERWTAP